MEWNPHGNENFEKKERLRYPNFLSCYTEKQERSIALGLNKGVGKRAFDLNSI